MAMVGGRSHFGYHLGLALSDVVADRKLSMPIEVARHFRTKRSVTVSTLSFLSAFGSSWVTLVCLAGPRKGRLMGS